MLLFGWRLSLARSGARNSTFLKRPPGSSHKYVRKQLPCSLWELRNRQSHISLFPQAHVLPLFCHLNFLRKLKCYSPLIWEPSVVGEEAERGRVWWHYAFTLLVRYKEVSQERKLRLIWWSHALATSLWVGLPWHSFGSFSIPRDLLH